LPAAGRRGGGEGAPEVARHGEFAAISEQIAEVNEKICEARPAAGTEAARVPVEAKKGLWTRSRGQGSRDRTAGAEAARRWAAGYRAGGFLVGDPGRMLQQAAASSAVAGR